MQKKEYSMDAGGRTLTATFSDLANQAHGSVLMKYGETVVLVTAVINKDAKEAAGYFPLTADYEQKFYGTRRTFIRLSFFCIELPLSSDLDSKPLFRTSYPMATL